MSEDDTVAKSQPAALDNESIEANGLQCASIPTPKDAPDARAKFDEQNSHPTHSYCPVKGVTHANLVGFGMKRCPLCSEDLERSLSKTESPQHKQEIDSSQPSHGLDEERNDGAENLGATRPPIQYKIRYEHADGYITNTQDWHEPLNLETTRKGSWSSTNLPVLEVTSVLKYRYRKDSSRSSPRQSDLTMDGILDDPSFRLLAKTTEITIHSRQVVRALRQLVTYHPGISLASESITLREPYCLWFHVLDNLLAYQQSYRPGNPLHHSEEVISKDTTKTAAAFTECDVETSNHITVIHNFLRVHFERKIEKEKVRWNQKPAVATYDMLWLLFKPGTMVYTAIDGSLAACVLLDIDVSYELIQKRAPYLVKLGHLDYNGRHVGRTTTTAFIRAFDGEKEITSLSVIPCEFYDKTDHGKLRGGLERRGEKFYRLLLGAQMHYSGDSLEIPARWYDGRVIIDSSTYYIVEKGKPPLTGITSKTATPGNEWLESAIYCESCRENAGKIEQATDESGDPWSFCNNIDPKATKSLDKYRYLLCPKRVWGFILKSRRWEKLNIECCHEAAINPRAIDTLVMSEERKTTIKSLVHRFTKQETSGSRSTSTMWKADFIENKGAGQIFLLHGSPGVGKTYTAECIAEHTGRPLLSLTCGDIGTDEKDMEDKLSKWFRLAEIWNAIMLIDEADVFLEKRATSDLRRNSLVSVFLRTMEYYRGILFLTTNRVGSFDDAFISRIHAVIHYSNLDNENRNQLWKQFFKKLRSERKDIKITEQAEKYVLTSEDIQQIQWNGREIRNAFQTAVALAEYRFAEATDNEEGAKPLLMKGDFQKVYEMTRDFKDYLYSVSGADESARAKQARERNDEYQAAN